MGGNRSSGSSTGGGASPLPAPSNPTVTSSIPAFALGPDSLPRLEGFAKSVGAASVNLDDYGKATVTMPDGTSRKAAIQPGLRPRWVWAEDYLPGD